MHFHDESDMRGSRPSLSHSKLPKVPFPVFDGTNPKLWISRSIDYFEMYDLESFAWIKLVSMHFSGSATHWLQSVEGRVKKCSWSE